MTNFRSPYYFISETGIPLLKRLMADEELPMSPLKRKDPSDTNSAGIRLDDKNIAHMTMSGVFMYDIGGSIEGLAIDTKEISKALDGLEANGLMIHMDSPGGSVLGVPELADKIANLGIPVAVFSDTLNASAAYYVSASADIIGVSKSASIGSIGVYVDYLDYSKALETEGIERKIIKNTGGTYKGADPTFGLTEEQTAYIQNEVDDLYSDFTTHILNFRTVDSTHFRGQTMTGARAVEANLADLVGSKEQTYNKLLNKVKS